VRLPSGACPPRSAAGRICEDNQEVWLEPYRYDMASSNDSYLCHDFDEAEPLLEYLISSASNSVSCRPQAKTSAETGRSGRANEENLGAVIRA
jgi:hypothetical protein